MAGQRAIQTLLIDLDDCMYRNHEMPELVRHNIERYMEEKLQVPSDRRVELCKDMYMNYGTTMAGLQSIGYKIDFEDWHAFVHGSLPYERLLQKDTALRALLQRIALPKYVFTNADIKHAEVCLDLLGVKDCFQGVICFESIMDMADARGLVRDTQAVICKPSQAAIELALEQAGTAAAATTLFLDDSMRNVAAGHEAGMYTVLVGRTGTDSPADHQIASILDLPDALPEGIWAQLTGAAAHSDPHSVHTNGEWNPAAAAPTNGCLQSAAQTASICVSNGEEIPAAATSLASPLHAQQTSSCGDVARSDQGPFQERLVGALGEGQLMNGACLPRTAEHSLAVQQ